MFVKISGSKIEDCKEVAIIYWKELDSLMVYVNREKTVLNYPYTHRVAASYMENLEIILEEYPDYISFVKDDLSLKVEDFKIDNNNFLLFIDTGLNKLFFSTLSYEKLQKIFPEIKRQVTKGIRLDVH